MTIHKIKNSIRKLSGTLLLATCLFLSACGESSDTGNVDQTGSSVKAETTSQEEPAVKGSRDNTPSVLSPEASGTDVTENDIATIDSSHISEGYLMVEYTGANEKVKLGITGPDQVTYYYNLKDGYEAFPLTAGDGAYAVTVYENVGGTSYSEALSTNLTVSLENEFGPYLYPSQYVNFDASSKAVAEGEDLAYSANTDMDVVENVYNYIISNLTYDYDKAATVQSGYLPDVDETLATKTGICFDYAALMATMLRTQRIPTRLEIGYKGEEYHAWISVYLPESGWVNGIIEFDGKDWNLMDPTFASTSKKPESFITENDDYLTKYVY